MMSKKPAKHFSQNNSIQHNWRDLIELSAWLPSQQAFELLINGFVSELERSLSSQVDLWLSDEIENLIKLEKNSDSVHPRVSILSALMHQATNEKRIVQDRGITIGG